MWALLFFFLEIANDLMFQVFCMTDSDCLRLLSTRNRFTALLSGFWPRRHTNAFSKVCIFVVIENESIESRPHYRSHAFSSVHNKTFENDTIARCHVS